MKRNKIFKILQRLAVIVIICLAVQACSDYLDVVPDNVPTLDHAFSDRFSSEGYLFTCYSYLPRYGNMIEMPEFMGSEEFFTYESPLNQLDQTMIGLTLGRQNVGDPIGNTWDGNRYGQPLYKAIRDCNIFLENVDKPFDLQAYERDRWVAEVKFLKAFYHFYLMQCYGPIILMDENLPVSASPDEMREYRTPFDECVQYVSDLLDSAAVNLPLKITDRTNELGRATRPIALAVKAKLLTMAASPLFNGNSDYSGMIDNRGEKLFNTTYDQGKWIKAAQACKEAIDVAEEAGFQLLTDAEVQHLYNLNDTLQQQFDLRMILYQKWNSETIWGSVRGNYKGGDNGIQDLTGCKISVKEMSQVHVRQQVVPTFDLVEAYYSKNGVPINEDIQFDYINRYKTRPAGDQDKWYVRTGEETAILHYNREPRFYASIGFDRAIWWGNGSYEFKNEDYADDSKVRFIKGRGSETAGRSASDYYSATGYWAKKLNNPLDETPSGGGEDWGGEGSIPFPIIRLADLYLLYAETLNESTETPPTDAYVYLDRIRERAGLNGVIESWKNYSVSPEKPLSKDGLRSIIHRERQIELAMEGARFWDLRRWKEAEQAWSVNVRAWNTVGESTTDFYKQIILDQRVFTRKDYLWPIREYNLSVNKNLVQNYGW